MIGVIEQKKERNSKSIKSKLPVIIPEYIDNKIILRIANNKKTIYRVIELMKVKQLSKDNKEMAKFLVIHAGILTNMYQKLTTFGTFLWSKNGNLNYGFFTISEHTNKEIALRISNEKINELYGSYRGSFKQIVLKPLKFEETIDFYKYIKNQQNKIAVVTGMPSPKHSKSGVTKENPFREQANQAELQMEEFIRGTGHEEYVFMSIIRPIPFSLAQRYADKINDITTEVEKTSERQENLNFSLVFPVNLGNGENAGTGDGYAYGVNENINNNLTTGISIGDTEQTGVNFGGSEGDTIGSNINYGRNINRSEADQITFSSSLSEAISGTENKGDTLGDSLALTYNEGTSETDTYSNSYTNTRGGTLSAGFQQSTGITDGITDTFGLTYSRGVNDSITAGETEGISENYTYTGNYSGNRNFSLGDSIAYGDSDTLGDSDSFSNSRNINASGSESISNSLGKTFSLATRGGRIDPSYSNSLTDQQSYSATMGNGIGDSITNSINKGNTQSLTNSQNLSDATGTNMGLSESGGGGYNKSKTVSYVYGNNYTGSVSGSTSRQMSVNEVLGYNANQSISETEAEGLSLAKATGRSITNGASLSEQRSRTLGSSLGRTKTLGETISYGNTLTNAYGDSITDGINYSKQYSKQYGTNISYGRQYSEQHSSSLGRGMGSNQNWNRNTNFGVNKNLGIGVTPSLGFGLTRTVRDQRKKQFLEIVSKFKESIWHGVRNGLFYYSAYYITRTQDVMSKGQGSLVSALAGDEPMRLQVVQKENTEELITDISSFSLNKEKNDKDMDGIRPYKYATLVNNQNLASIIQIPRIEYGGLRLAENIPAFRVKKNKNPGPTNVFIGQRIIPEDGEASLDINEFLEIGRNDMNHTIISGISRVGKTVTAFRYIYELSKKKVENPEIAKRNGRSEYLLSRALILDWKNDWRSLYLLNERAEFFTIAGSVNRLRTNLLATPKYVNSDDHFATMGEGFCLSCGLGSKANEMFRRTAKELCTWDETLYNRLSEYLLKLEEIVENLINNKKARTIISFLSEAKFLRDGIKSILSMNDKLMNADTLGFNSSKKEVTELFSSEEIVAKNSRLMTMAHMYFYLEVEKLFKKANGEMQSDLAEAYERLTERLRIYTITGKIKDTFCYNKEDMILITDMMEGNKIVVIEGREIQSNLEVKKFFSYVTTGDIYNYASSRDSLGLTQKEEITAIVYEEAMEVFPTKEGSANKQVLDVPQDIYDKLWSQGAGYGLRGVAITQNISHHSDTIIVNSGTSFYMNTGSEKDINVIINMIGKTHTMDVRDVEFKKFIPLMPKGWVISVNKIANYSWGDGEASLFKTSMINTHKVNNIQLLRKNIKNSLMEVI